METTFNEAKTVTTAAPLDSAAIDHSLLVRTIEHQNNRIAAATWQLKRALSLPKGSPRREMHFQLALKSLGGLGAA